MPQKRFEEPTAFGQLADRVLMYNVEEYGGLRVGSERKWYEQRKRKRPE